MLILNSSIDIGDQLQDKLNEVNKELMGNESKECSEFVDSESFNMMNL